MAASAEVVSKLVYVEVQLPIAIYPHGVAIIGPSALSTVNTRCPQAWEVRGCRPGETTFELLTSGSRSFAGDVFGTKYTSLSAFSGATYDRFRVVITSAFGGAPVLVSIPEVRFYGRW